MTIIYLVLAYLVAGLIFSIPFLLKWVNKIDESVHESPWTFRLIILPGCIVFWPVLLKKYWKIKSHSS